METIINYLENMFKSLPQTPEVLKLKDELTTHMEEKYNELITEGKSQNEAIGIVIAEFGNIDEILSELDITLKQEETAVFVSQETVDAFIQLKIKMDKYIAFGVFLCLLGVASLIFFTTIGMYIPIFEENVMTFLGLSSLLILIAAAVGIFIYTDSKLAPFKYLEEPITLSPTTKLAIEEKNKQVATKKIIFTIVGVLLCILSPLLLIGMVFISGEFSGLGVSALLLTIAIAVVLFITSSSVTQATDILLKRNDFTYEKKKSEKIIGAIASIWWPLSVIIYLGWSFLTNDWQITWIVWPISGILFGGISGLISTLSDK